MIRPEPGDYVWFWVRMARDLGRTMTELQATMRMDEVRTWLAVLAYEADQRRNQ